MTSHPASPFVPPGRWAVLVVSLVGLFALSGPVRGQSAAPVAAPLPTGNSSSPSASIPATPPLTDAQKAVLQGKFATFVTQFTASTGIRLVPIPAGTFLMGSPADEMLPAGARLDDPIPVVTADGRTIYMVGLPSEGPQTKVTLTKDFFLEATDVTQGQWTAVMGNNPSHFKGDPLLPVEMVTWGEAMVFCQKLTERERSAGRLPEGYTFTLPTEAQWEYACRAGTKEPYGGDLDATAWYAKNSGRTPHPVYTKAPNAWGLYDMHGNVWQWCDWIGAYPGGAVTDPAGLAAGFVRGGHWNSVATSCRSASRGVRPFAPDYHNEFTGFRLALSAVREASAGSKGK